MTDQIYQTVYTSAATEDWSPERLHALLEGARRHNASVDVTGVLLYADRTFFQVLEGPKAAVQGLCSHIRNDPRHTRFAILYEKEVAQRSFPEWSMGYEDISQQDLGKIEGLSNLMNEPLKYTRFSTAQAVLLMNSFRAGFWRVTTDEDETVETEEK